LDHTQHNALASFIWNTEVYLNGFSAKEEEVVTDVAK